MPNTKTIVAILAVLLGIAAWRGFHPASSFAVDGDPTWDRAVEVSQSTGRPGLVLFTAGWCGACRQLHSQVLTRDDVREAIDSRFTFVTVDLTGPTETNQVRASKCGVKAIPTLIRYDKDGRETARTHGMDPQAMLKWLDE